MREIRRELFTFMASDIDAIEEHFERMAKKGWMLEKTGEYVARYKRMEPQDLKFSIDLFPKLSFFDYPEKEEVLEYRNLCIDVGWEFIDSCHKFQVFASPKERNLLPIQTDDRMKQMIISKSLVFELIMLLISLGIFIWSLDKIILSFYSTISSYIFRSNTIMVTVILAPIMIIPVTFSILSNIIWILRAKIAIKRERPLPKTRYWVMRIKTIVFFYILILLVISVITAIGLDILNRNFTGIITISPTIIGFTIGTLFKINKNKRKRDKFDNMGLFVLMLFIVFLGINILMPRSMGIGESRELNENYKGLKLEDFQISSPSYTRFSKGNSIILPKQSSYEEISSSDKGYLYTEYLKAVNSKTARYIFNGMIKEDWEKDSRNIKRAVEYKFFDEAYYVNNERNNREDLLLLKGREIFRINTALDLKDEKNIDIITDKLLY